MTFDFNSFGNKKEENVEAKPTSGFDFGSFGEKKESKELNPKPESNNNMFQQLAVNLIGRPAIRTTQAIIGAGINAFGGEESKKKFDKIVKEPVKIPILGTVQPAPEKLDKKGVLQIAKEGGKSALDISTIGYGNVVNAGIKKGSEKALQKIGAKKLSNLLPNVLGNAGEAVAYNTATNVLNDRDTFANTGVAGFLGAAIPPLITKGIPALSKAKNNLTDPEAIMNRVARLTPSDAREFKRLAGTSHGEYLRKTGNFGDPDKIIATEWDKFINSKNLVDDEMSKLPGLYKSPEVDNMLSELIEREAKIGIEGADTALVVDLAQKNKGNGLNMSEITDLKRLYERTAKMDYLKTNNTDGIERATRIDKKLRKWRLDQAKILGFNNLAEMDKQTQLSRFIVDKLGKQLAGKTGNDAITITDWIMLSGGDPTAISGFLTKKFFSNKRNQAMFAKLLNKSDDGASMIKPDVGPSKIPMLPEGNPNLPQSQNFNPIIKGGPTSFEAPAKTINRFDYDSQANIATTTKNANNSISNILPKTKNTVNKSKINELSNKTYYHGSPVKGIKDFKLSKPDGITDIPGISFSSNKNYAKDFGDNIYEVKITPKNPLIIEDGKTLPQKLKELGYKVDDAINGEEYKLDSFIKKGGWDSIVMEGNADELIVLDKNIIKNKTTPTKTIDDQLITEARKYKSAEEFVKAQDNYYHGTPEKTFKLDTNKPLFLTDNFDSANTYAGYSYNTKPTGKVIEVKLKNGKTLDLNNKTTVKKVFNEIFNTPENKKLFAEIPEEVPKINKYGENTGYLNPRESLSDFQDWLWEKFPSSENTAIRSKYIKAFRANAQPTRDMVYDKWSEIIDYAKKQGYDFIDHTTEDPSASILFKEKVVLNPKNSVLTKSQLTDIWNKANAGNNVDPLTQEAKKYKSTEEFVKAQEKTGLFNEYNPNARIGGSSVENTPLTQFGYKPNEEITIYRGVPKGVKSINDGDWVTTNKQLAKDYAGTGEVISKKVKASELFAESGDDALEELVYSTKQKLSKSQLEEIWKKANKSNKK